MAVAAPAQRCRQQESWLRWLPSSFPLGGTSSAARPKAAATALEAATASHADDDDDGDGDGDDDDDDVDD